MKTKILMLLVFLISMEACAQGVLTPVDRLKIKYALKDNTANRVLVQDSITKEVKWILKSTLVTPTPTLQQVTTAGATSNLPITITTTSNSISGISTSGIGLSGFSTSGYGIYGQSSSNSGIQGQSSSSHGVYGTSTTGNGITGISASANGVYGYSTSGVAGSFAIPSISTANIATFQKNNVNQSSVSHDGKITANAFIKNGGTSSQFLKADGFVDNNVYLTSADLPSTLDLFATTTPDPLISGYSVLVRNILEARYDDVAVNVSTGAITTTNQLLSSLITDTNVISGNPGVFNFTTIGNIRRVSGSGEATFYFRIYKRDSSGVETLITQSDNTLPVVGGGTYVEFSAVALWNDGVFLSTDRIVLKYYANRISGGSNPTYEFQFGGITPVRSTAAVPVAVLPNIFLSNLVDVEDVAPLPNEILYWNDSANLWKHSLVNDLLVMPTLQQVTTAGATSDKSITIDVGGNVYTPAISGTSSGYGVYGFSNENAGVFGTGYGIGVKGDGPQGGVVGVSSDLIGVEGVSTNGTGVYAASVNSSAFKTVMGNSTNSGLNIVSPLTIAGNAISVKNDDEDTESANVFTVKKDGSLLIGDMSTDTDYSYISKSLIEVSKSNTIGNFFVGYNLPNAQVLFAVDGTGKTFTNGLNVMSETASTIASFDALKNVKSLPTTTYPSLTELSYGKGVTSNIQTQLGAKAVDANVLHKTGNETKTGTLTVNAPIYASNAINANSISGYGINASSDDGDAVYGYAVSGVAIRAISETGSGIYAASTGGDGVYTQSANGKALIANISDSNTSNIAEFQKQGVNQASISHDGNILGTALKAPLVTTTTDVLTLNAGGTDVIIDDTSSTITAGGDIVADNFKRAGDTNANILLAGGGVTALSGLATKAITVRKISTTTTLADSDNGTVILLTTSCTVTLPNGLASGFNCSFATQSGATLTYSLGGSVTLINNTATTMPPVSSHTLVNTGTANEYLTVGL